MDVICQFASDGMHEGSEEECLQTFDKVQHVFEYLIQYLTVESEGAMEYLKGLDQPRQPKARQRLRDHCTSHLDSGHHFLSLLPGIGL